MSTQELVSCPPTWVCCRVMARPDTRRKRRACGELRELAAETAVECPAGTRSELKRAQFEALVQAVTQQELTPEQRVRLHELTELYFQSEAGVMLSTEIRMSSCSLAVQRLPSLYIMLYIYIIHMFPAWPVRGIACRCLRLSQHCHTELLRGRLRLSHRCPRKGLQSHANLFASGHLLRCSPTMCKI